MDSKNNILEQKLTLIKFNLLSQGMRINKSAYEHLIGYKNPIRTRSGASGGLDIRLPHNVYVNVPVTEKFASFSPFCLDYNETGFVIMEGDNLVSEIELLPMPAYYESKTSDGIESMVRVGQVCTPDRFCYGMTGSGCHFWNQERRCKFCSIGNNFNADASQKKARYLLEVLELAINDPENPVRHVLIGGGTPSREDRGALMAADLCKLIKSRLDISIYVMIAAPSEDFYIDILHDSGADELGMNLEFWGESAWKYYVPGKNSEIGKDRYIKALEYAVKVFGPVNTRTIFISGLEEKKYTIQGASTVASIGVMPIISPFRPLDGTMLEDVKGFNGKENYDLYEHIRTNISKYKIPLGPTCICCQNNTLAMPFGENYKFY
jgi:hypothetical protein